MTGEQEPSEGRANREDRPIEIDGLDVLMSAALKGPDSQREFFEALNAARRRIAARSATLPRPRSPIHVPADRLAAIGSCEYVDAILDDVFDLVLSQDDRDLVAAAMSAEHDSFDPWQRVRQRLQLGPDSALARFGAAANDHLHKSWHWLFPARTRAGAVHQAMTALAEPGAVSDPNGSERELLARRSRWYRSALDEIRELARRDVPRPLRANIPILFAANPRAAELGDIFSERSEWPALEQAGRVVYALAKSALRRVVEDNQFLRKHAPAGGGSATAKGVLDSFQFDVPPKSFAVALIRAQSFFARLAEVIRGEARIVSLVGRIRVLIDSLKTASAERPISLLDVETLLELGIEGGGRYAEDSANLLGFIAYRRGDLDRATRLIQRVIARAGTDTYGLETLAHALTNLAAIQIARREHAAALILSERAQLLKTHLGVAPYGGASNLLCFWIMEATAYGDERAWHYLEQVMSSSVSSRFFERQLWQHGGENTLAEGLARTGFDRRMPQLVLPFSVSEWRDGGHVRWDSRHPEFDSVVV